MWVEANGKGDQVVIADAAGGLQESCTARVGTGP